MAELATGAGELPRRLTRALAARVESIHPELSWELADGILARRALVVSGEGAPALRVLTERWRRAAPPDDDDWEFYGARPPNPAAMHSPLQVGRRTVKPLDARFGTEVDTARGRVHVAISHPDLGYLEDAERLWLAFLLLDWVLGEDDVERWVGEVRLSDAPQHYDGPGLRRVIGELSAEMTATAHWAHLEGIDDQGNRALVDVRIPAPRSAYPLFDAHGAVAIPLLRTPEPPDEITALAIEPPLPDSTELYEVEQLTQALLALLGDSAVLAAVETVPNRRTLHLYADSEGVVPDQVAAWLSGQQRTDLTVEWSADPGWELVRHFT